MVGYCLKTSSYETIAWGLALPRFSCSTEGTGSGFLGVATQEGFRRLLLSLASDVWIISQSKKETLISGLHLPLPQN